MPNPQNDRFLSFTKALDAIDKEREMQEQGLSFRTRIVKTKKRGLEYRITPLDVASD